MLFWKYLYAEMLLKFGQKKNERISCWILLPWDQTMTNGWQSFIQLTTQIGKGVYPEVEFTASLYFRVSDFVHFK